MVYLSLALGCISAWMVPNLGVEIAMYRYALTKSSHWRRGPLMVAANRRITQTCVFSITACVLLYILTALLIGRSTQTLDERAIKILNGISFLLSSVAVIVFSIETPMWLGVYYSKKSQFGPLLGTSLYTLTRSMCLNIIRIFARGYILTSVFYCGAEPLTIPISVGSGIVVGYLIWVGVYIGRTSYKAYKTQIAILLATLLSMFSSYCFMMGCTYIHDVWGAVEWQPVSTLALSSLVFGLLAGGTCHYLTWVYSQHMFGIIDPDQSVRFQTLLFSPNLIERIQREFKSFQGQLSVVVEEDEEEKEEEPLVPVEREETVTDYGSVLAQLPDEDTHKETEATSASPMEPCFQQTVAVLRWIGWIAINLFLLYVIVVNIGASIQTSAVMKQLPDSYAFLYPPDYNHGTVCAWDKPGPHATIRTFDTPAEAYGEKFSIVHCGACGQCSNWNDLTLQWTTRHDLALRSQHCAKQFVLGGGMESVQACNRDEIGFTDDCARCWTNDEYCAKRHCVFIFLQGVIINKLTSFEVGPGQITSATCDEAMCGPVFGPCSGAIRRRMNIESSISRPEYQQCHIIEQDWARVFDHP